MVTGSLRSIPAVPIGSEQYDYLTPQVPLFITSPLWHGLAL